MSSGDSRTTSSSSRLSQFGLYRTIDARTEEFLRLSRKRQIRQGCACAAVSTAITVSVVVTVILVYEYTVSVDSNINQKLRKPTWHGLFNDTSPFEAKYNKAKINIDPVTLKLLPVILKAINRNKHLDKTIEDSSSYPSSNKEITESTFKMKVPSTLFRGNTNIEHKAPPVVRFKNLFTNSDYFKKIRHTKDYERMLEYFNKMIYGKTHGTSLDAEIKSEKTTTKTTTQKNYIHTKFLHAGNNVSQKVIQNSTDNLLFKNLLFSSSNPKKKNSQIFNPINFNEISSTVKITTTVKKTRDITFSSKQLHKPPEKKMDNAIICKCPERIVNLLKKLITDIKKIIPEIAFSQPPCTKNTNRTTSSSTASATTIKTASTTAETLSDIVPQFTTAPRKNLLNQIFKSTSQLMNNYLPKEDGLPIFLLQPFDEQTYDNVDTFVNITTEKYSVEPTESIRNIKSITRPMSKKHNAEKIWSTQRPNEIKRTSDSKMLTLRNKTEFYIENDINNDGAGKVTNDNLNENKQTTENTTLNGYNDEKLVNQSKINALSYLSTGLEHRIPLRKSGKLAKNYKINEGEETPILPIFKKKITNWGNSKYKNNYANSSKTQTFNVTNSKTSPKRFHKYDSEHVPEKTSHLKDSFLEEKHTGATISTNWLYMKNYETGSKSLKNQEATIQTAMQDATVTYFENYENQEVITPQRWTSVNVVPVTKNHTLFDDEPAIENYAREIYNDFDDTFLNHTEPRETNYSLQTVNSTEINSNQTNDKITHQSFDYDEFKLLDDQERDTPEEVTNRAATDKYPIKSGAQTEKNTYTNNYLNSMLPISRPTYLEYHRNNWKLYNADYTNTDNGFDIV